MAPLSPADREYDVVVIGAGAAGLFCASQLGQMGKSVIVLDNGKKPGRKILMSGGGRCNFTNLNIEPGAFISHNPHFCKSALARYTQWDFIELIRRYDIPYHEKTLGQLFCDNSAEDIVNMLLEECKLGNVKIALRQTIKSIEKLFDDAFSIGSQDGEIITKKLVIATGGLSMPGLGATPLGYQIAEQFDLPVYPTRAGLVPLTLHKPLLDHVATLSGISIASEVKSETGMTFKENTLFTHRGLSGPAILQISNYWKEGESLILDLLPGHSLKELLIHAKSSHPNQQTKTFISQLLPKRVVELFYEMNLLPVTTLAELSLQKIETIDQLLHSWAIKPNSTEGYRTAEVTLGGIDTNYISSKTMEVKSVKGLYFIGEVLDVTGWLGGYNFQWAWSSAYAAADAIIYEQ
ncbi:NAD(P)/FAD-dependent oxidoreductase [Thorsellia kenyensis]|uniref:NAD(P)/FAD-dependent oxidoreductase n=1 Tax=Thorsellia kenyensis TaxID=1549888 RepID=A0ABV6CBL8_9GAMM